MLAGGDCGGDCGGGGGGDCGGGGDEGDGQKPGAKCGREGKVYARQHLELSQWLEWRDKKPSTQAQSLHNYLSPHFQLYILCLKLTYDIKYTTSTGTEVTLYII